MHRPIFPDSLEGNILHGLDVLVCNFENVLSLRFHNDDCDFAQLEVLRVSLLQESDLVQFSLEGFIEDFQVMDLFCSREVG